MYVIKYCLVKLTRNPELIAGQILRLLILKISKVKIKDNLDNGEIILKTGILDIKNF